MPIKIYHPDHGFVLTNDQTEIDMLVAKGGKVVVKCKEAFAEPEEPIALDNAVIEEEVEETPKDKILDKPEHINKQHKPEKIFKKREPDNTAMRMITTGVF